MAEREAVYADPMAVLEFAAKLEAERNKYRRALEAIRDGEHLAEDIARAALSEDEACPICGIAFQADDDCLHDFDLGIVHASCCGPERENYVNLDTGESLGPDDPLPTPFKYSTEDAGEGEADLRRRFPIRVHFSEEDGGYIAVVPDLPGCCSYGDTIEEAVREVRDAINAWMEAAVGAGNPIPVPTPSSDPAPTEAEIEARERKRAADIALAIDSGRGNEKEIAKAILSSSPKPPALVGHK